MAMTASDDRNPYDEIPYNSFPFAQTHPTRLATIATLFGIRPATVENCRVLELACSSGGNLIPMAEQLPGSRFVGVDGASVAIAEGKKTIEALGLKNVELNHLNILDVGPRFGTFDYIIAHGVYSWVPPSVQQKILEICRENLAPSGVAYVSYNTYPGWHMRGMIRDVMFYRGRFFAKLDERLREARALVDFLAKSTPTEGNPYGILLNDELRLLQRKDDYYLIHEFLEENNVPTYFYQFVERAETAGLQYLGEAEFSMMSVHNFPPEIATMLRRIASDTVQMEQYMDFVRNRMFRQTLVCHRDVTLEREPSVDRVRELFVASSAEPETPIEQKGDGNLLPERPDGCFAQKVPVPVLHSHDRVTFRRPGSTMTTTEPLVKAAMLHLRELWPQSAHFGELLAAARARIRPGPVILEREHDEGEARNLAQPLLRCYATTHVDLSVSPTKPSLRGAVADRPVASPLARHQAESASHVTNLWHEMVPLTDLQRFVLKHLDGRHDQAALTESLADEVRRGTLVVHDKGERVSDDGKIKQIVERILGDALGEIARKGLLATVE